MRTGFIIMRIGDAALDNVCTNAIEPALKACGLDPKRVDKHEEGGPLKSEIIKFLERADIIVADLTDERPNCYLEVGYAMGLDKFRNLILTARHDHNIRAEGYNPDGPKVHFDLDSYSILFWHPDRLSDFRLELEKRIKRRLAVVLPTLETVPKLDEKWVHKHREAAEAGLASAGRAGYLEVILLPLDGAPSTPQSELLRIAENAQMGVSGWPIGVVIRNGQDDPKPTADGIRTEITLRFSGTTHYDYWTLRKDGVFFLLRDLWSDSEDAHVGSRLYYHHIVQQVTEVLLYVGRLYDRMGLSRTDRIAVRIMHRGIVGRALAAPTNRMPILIPRTASDDPAEEMTEVRLGEIEESLVDEVSRFVAPVLSMFDFFTLQPEQLREFVESFVSRASGSASL
jgi:nucleoside 2-deoxyribosyltransferase